MTIAIISHPDCLLHDMSAGHPEAPARIATIQAAIQHYPFKTAVSYYEAPCVTREQLLRVHPEAYIDWLASVAPHSGLVALDADTFMNPHTLAAASRAAGSVPLAVDLVMAGDAGVAFCNVRPPGHHALVKQAMGFCFYNNIAVGVMHAFHQHSIQRAAIIDFDVHHGNGTQAIFQHDARLMLCSSFEHPFYPGYEAGMDNAHILNVPLPAYTQSGGYRQKVADAWFAKLDAFAPEIIFFSAGFDAHVSDPLADIELTVADYVWITEQIRALAVKHSQGRMISVLEGGYQLPALAECVPAHINAMVV